MGVKQLIKLSKNGISIADLSVAMEEAELSALSGKKGAVDVSIVVHMAMRSVRYRSQWTPKHHVEAVLDLMAKLDTAGISHVWVFDAGVSRPIKQEEQKRRQTAMIRSTEIAALIAEKERAELIEQSIECTRGIVECAANLLDFKDCDGKEREIRIQEHVADVVAKARIEAEAMVRVEEPTTDYAFTKEHADDIRAELDRMGIEHINAPPGVEAEHACAALTRDITGSPKYCDFVISTDMDVLPYAGVLLKLPPKYGLPYRYIDYRRVLSEFDLTLDEFRRVCVCLGTDFAPKVDRVGPLTAIAKFRKVKFTPEQEAAVAEFARDIY